MPRKQNKKSNPSLCHENKNTRKNHSDWEWEKIKPDVFRILMEQKGKLKVTMAAIKKIHGFEACSSKWKQKLNAWGYRKNIPAPDMRFIVAKGTKRKQDGKDTVFSYENIRVEDQKIRNFKKRKITEVSPMVATPPKITYRTPSVHSEESSLEEMYQESTLNSPPPPQSTISSMDDIDLVMSLESEMQGSLLTKIPILEVPHISMLDRFLAEESDPWFPGKLSHQLGDHEKLRAKQQKTIERVTKLPDVIWKREASPAVEIRQQDEHSEAAVLDELCDHAVKLVKYQTEHGESAGPTLQQEFELAKVVDRCGNQEEAEYHCRKILDKHPHTDVQSYLGMILVDTSRWEEATFMLFSAISGFIIQFALASIEANSRCFEPIRSLFNEIVLQTNQDWNELISCMRQMMITIQTAISEETVDEISPQLFLHGFSFAYECSVLKFIEPAKYMYKVLLEHSAFHLDPIIHGIHSAIAHREYGNILKGEGRWIPSAKQLLLACESILHSRTHNTWLNKVLEMDYADVLLHLTTKSNEEETLIEQLRNMFARTRRQNQSHIDDTSGTVEVWRVEEYLMSDSPMPLIAVDPSANAHVVEFGSTSRSFELPHQERDLTSSASLSASVSHKYGLTYSVSEITGISDSVFMVP